MYISAQVVVARYNAIYGSFAALPLFLVWLQLSWMVVLLGAQIAHAHQFLGNLTTGHDVRNSRQEDKKRCALSILRWIIQRFSDGASPPTAERIAQHLTLPHTLVAQMIDHLRQCGLISAVTVEGSDDPAYQPAKDIHTIRIASVLDALDRVGQPAVPPHQQPEFDAITQAIETMQKEIDRSPTNVLVKDI
jgi:membrane protein